MEKTHKLLAQKKKPTRLSQGPTQSRVNLRSWNKQTFPEEKVDSVFPWIPLKPIRLLVLPQKDSQHIKSIRMWPFQTKVDSTFGVSVCLLLCFDLTLDSRNIPFCPYFSMGLFTNYTYTLVRLAYL